MSAEPFNEVKEVLPKPKVEGPPPSGKTGPERVIQSGEACHAGANSGQSSGYGKSPAESESY